MADLSKFLKNRENKGLSLSSKSNLVAMKEKLGEGPMRFAPEKVERTLEQQLDDLRDEERACFDAIMDRWDAKFPAETVPDDLVLRYARNSPGVPYNAKASWNIMKKLYGDKRIQHQLSIKAAAMDQQLMTKTLFPLPGLKTKDDHEVFYMRPSRYSPGDMKTGVVIDNLAYCMNSMLEKEAASTQGIAFLAYMNDWTMKNFSTDYCFKFMQMLQGNRIPVRVNLFLIVNPPRWFGKVWNIMKGMLSESFQKKVHMIPEAKLSEFLQAGFEDYLPDEMETGRVNTNLLVEDFLTYRIAVEEDFSATQTAQATLTARGKRKFEQSHCSLSLPDTLEQPKAAPKKKGFMSFWSGKKRQQKEEVLGQRKLG